MEEGSGREEKTIKGHLLFEQALCSQHIYNAFDKKMFEKNKSQRARAKNWIQFWPRITAGTLKTARYILTLLKLSSTFLSFHFFLT